RGINEAGFAAGIFSDDRGAAHAFVFDGTRSIALREFLPTASLKPSPSPASRSMASGVGAGNVVVGRSSGAQCPWPGDRLDPALAMLAAARWTPRGGVW